jgi:hypothetical protein
MVKSAPMRDHSIVIKPRRRGSGAIVILLVLLLILSIALAGFGVFSPARLAYAQEQTLSLLHGGVIGRTEHTYVDVCVRTPDVDGPQAVTRTVRTSIFRDGTSLSVTFSSSPTPAVADCNG